MDNDYRKLTFADLLAILFIGLKLTNEIDWSWWLVLLPFWLPIVLISMLNTKAFR